MISKRCGSFWCMVQFLHMTNSAEKPGHHRVAAGYRPGDRHQRAAGRDLVLTLLGKCSAFIFINPGNSNKELPNPGNSNKELQPDLVFLCMIKKLHLKYLILEKF